MPTRKRKVIGMAGPKVVKQKKQKIELPRCSECGDEVTLNSFGRLPCKDKHPLYHGCGRVLCSGRYCHA